MKITELLKKEEGKTIEFKQDLSSPKNILKSIIAFANSAGGIILIGIEDNSKAILGIDNSLDEEERLCNIISDSIEPRLAPDIEILNWEGRSILVVEVFPSQLKPHYLKSIGIEKGTFIRVGSTNRKADKEFIIELKRSISSFTYDEEIIQGINLDTLDVQVMSRLFKDIKNIDNNTMETLHLIAKNQKDYSVTVGGLLLFGKDREKYYPDAWIQCGRFQNIHLPHG